MNIKIETLLTYRLFDEDNPEGEWIIENKGSNFLVSSKVIDLIESIRNCKGSSDFVLYYLSNKWKTKVDDELLNELISNYVYPFIENSENDVVSSKNNSYNIADQFWLSFKILPGSIVSIFSNILVLLFSPILTVLIISLSCMVWFSVISNGINFSMAVGPDYYLLNFRKLEFVKYII